jgi:hypothetical protein
VCIKFECILEVEACEMDVLEEITKQLEQLPPAMQEQVLRFVVSLTGEVATGEKGADLRQFSGSLDSTSARQMTEAIERECGETRRHQKAWWNGKLLNVRSASAKTWLKS